MDHHKEHKEHEAKNLETLSYRVIGCAIEVHRFLGPGLLESTYQRCLSRELELKGIPHTNEAHLPIDYKGVRLDCGYRIDMLIDEQLVVEIKSVKKLEAINEAQLLTYLKLSKIKVGLLMNFNTQILKEGIKRYVL